MICQDFLSWHDRFLFQMFDNPKFWDESIYAWNCFDLWTLMQRAKAFFRQEIYYSHGAEKRCLLYDIICQGVTAVSSLEMSSCEVKGTNPPKMTKTKWRIEYLSSDLQIWTAQEVWNGLFSSLFIGHALRKWVPQMSYEAHFAQICNVKSWLKSGISDVGS